MVGSSGSGPGVINVTGDEASVLFDGTQTLSNTTINLGTVYTDAVYSNDLFESSTADDQVLTLASTVRVDVQGFVYLATSGDYSGDGDRQARGDRPDWKRRPPA